MQHFVETYSSNLCSLNSADMTSTVLATVNTVDKPINHSYSCLL